MDAPNAPSPFGDSGDSVDSAARLGAKGAPLHVLAVLDRPAPRLLVAQPPGAEPAREPWTIPLAGDFRMRVLPVRRCVGRWDDGGGHVPCPTAEPVARHRQCRACSGLEDPECVFEPKCRVDPASCTCVATFKGVPHVVYLAFHGTLPKVGLTQAWRVEGRLREQGADAWLAITPAPDRGTARQVEMAVSYLYGYPEHRGHRETLPQLARPVPWDAIERRAEECRARLGRDYPVEATLHRIVDHPLAQPVGGVPRRVPTEGLHAGAWVGVKGTHLVYREAPRPGRLHVGAAPLAAIKRGDLVGRRVVLESP